MKVFKFGGASVKEAAGVRNLAEIIKNQGEGNAVVIVSAMGKTTNALEEVVKLYADRRLAEARDRWQSVQHYHETIIHQLTGDFSAVFRTASGGTIASSNRSSKVEVGSMFRAATSRTVFCSAEAELVTRKAA